MEGRLMLAATWLDYAPSNLQATQFSFEAGQLTPGSGQMVQLTMPIEGGFVSHGYPRAVTASDGILVLSGGTISDANSYQLFTDAQPLVNLSGLGATSIRSSITSSFDIRPVKIVMPVENNADLNLGSEQLVADDRRLASFPEQGGSIPIEPILARGEPDRGLNERVITTLVADEPARPTHLRSVSQERAISGEWARAMVFEMSGGEPLEIGLPAARSFGRLSPGSEEQPDAAWNKSSSSSALEAAQREALGNEGLQRATLEGATERTAAVASREQAAEIQAAALLTHESNERVDMAGSSIERLDLGEWAGSDRRSKLALLALTSPANGRHPAMDGQGLGVRDTDLSPAEAIAALGENEKPLMRSATDDEPPPGSFDAMPLLMLLALEQIAAANWPRANKDAPAVLAWQPRRRSFKVASGA